MARVAAMHRLSTVSRIANAKSPLDSVQGNEMVEENINPTEMTSLEEGLLVRQEAYGKLYKSILEKYDRSFSRREEGGSSYDFSDPVKFEGQLKNLNHKRDLDKRSYGNYSCRVSDCEFTLNKEEEEKLHKKLLEAEAHVNWDVGVEEHQHRSAAQERCNSSDEEEGGSFRQARCKRKSRKRKRSCLDSTPCHSFFSTTLDTLMDSSYKTSDEEDEDGLPSTMAADKWMEELLESCYYDSDIPRRRSTCKAAVKPVPAFPCADDGGNLSEGSIELDSSFYDSDCQLQGTKQTPHRN